MQIKDLQVRQGNIELTGEITEKGDVRSFEKFGRPGKVCNLVLKDDSGTVKLSLFNEDVDKIEVGDKVQIQNGWVSEWQGEKQVSTGKFGKITVLGKAEKKEETKAPTDQKEKSDDDDADFDVEEEDIEM
jgi:replication factor A1